MTEAIREAIQARDADEVPIGCVIVHENKVIGKAFNQTRLLKDPTAHAEMIAITQAANSLKYERLLDTQLYVTVEPCAMCVGAIVQARIPVVYYGAKNQKYGACGSVVDLTKEKLWNHNFRIEGGHCSEDCSFLMQEYFRSKRKS